MPDAITPTRTNGALWLGLTLAVLGVLCNFVFFIHPPLQHAIPWLSLLLGIGAIILLILATKNLFTERRSIAGRIFGVFVVLFTLLLSAASIFGFYQSRAIPASANAPQIGNVAPDFTLTDTNGNSVTLSALFSPAAAAAGAAQTKAVLLIFYRGYW